MGAIKDYVNQGFAVGDIAVNTFDETGARIRIKDFYDLDLMERKRIVDFAGKVDVELLNLENKIIVETDGKFAEYYKSSEIDTKFYKKTEIDSKFSNYNTKTEISDSYVPKTLTAQETIKGITNFKDMKKQVNYLSGADYKDNNEFGNSLKNIITGEMYYYGTKPYMAKVTATNASGYLVPDTINFLSITNKDINSRFESFKNYYSNITSTGFNIPQALLDWWIIDKNANVLIIVLEDIGTSIDTVVIMLSTLKQKGTWEHSVNGKWFRLVLSGDILKIQCPGATLKLNSACFQ